MLALVEIQAMKYTLLKLLFVKCVARPVSRNVTQLINYTSKILSTLFPLIFLSKHISLYTLGRFKDQFCISCFRPRTFLQCFALYSCCSKPKHVSGSVLGQKTGYKTPPLVSSGYHLTFK